MDFLHWWFDTHYVWSTILTPTYTILWAIYYDLTARALVALLYIFTILAGKITLGRLAGR